MSKANRARVSPGASSSGSETRRQRSAPARRAQRWWIGEGWIGLMGGNWRSGRQNRWGAGVSLTCLPEMDSPPRIKTRHGELTLEEIADLLPGAGDVMVAVSRVYGNLWHAAAGGNWDLASFYFRRTRTL